ncbi:MAG: hypothetical protein HN350_20535 [Phycisphaerales bacterium]|nr:hypothetical protein [Phycisphaerales bacterium]
MDGIDEDLFFAAGNRTIINAKRAKRNRKYSYLLAGHIRCGICGYSGYGFTDSRSKKKNQYYRCSSAVKAHRTCPTQSRGIPTKRVDNAVWEWLVKLLTDETSLNEGLKELSRKQENEVTVKKKDLQNLEGLIDETESRISRLVREITNHEPGIILDTLRDEIKKYGKQKESQLKEYQAISSDVQSKCDYKEVEKQIHEMVKEVKHKLPNATFEVKRSLLDVLNVQVTFHREIEEVWFEAECSISPQKEGLIASSTS